MAKMQRWKVTEPYLSIKCSLGEGPFYSGERHELRFMDINNNKMYFIDLDKGPESLKTVDTGMPVGVTADVEGEEGVILAGVKDGVTKFHPATGKHEYITKFWGNDTDKAKRFRANDGAVDSSGRFWIEAFNEPLIQEPKEEAVLFRMDKGTLIPMQERVAIPNGISWNAQDDTMFFTDSPVQNVYAFDYDSKTGDISNKRVFYHHEEEGVDPDGHAMDVEGYIWHACYGGSKVIRISPEGKLVGEISLPTRNITCPVFVGTELFITSAAEQEEDKHPESAKFAGNLFRVDVGVRGMPKHKARLVV